MTLAIANRVPHQLKTRLRAFVADETGIVTADYVVISAVVIGLGVATVTKIADGIQDATTATTLALAGVQVNGSGTFAALTYVQEFFNVGIEAYPDDQRAAWISAREEVQGFSPDGFNYDPEFNETRYIDLDSGNPIYENDAGTLFSIGGIQIEAAAYDNSRRISFKSGFDAYWAEQ